ITIYFIRIDKSIYTYDCTFVLTVPHRNFPDNQVIWIVQDLFQIGQVFIKTFFQSNGKILLLLLGLNLFLFIFEISPSHLLVRPPSLENRRPLKRMPRSFYSKNTVLQKVVPLLFPIKDRFYTRYI